MDATGFDASTMEERSEPLEWSPFISSLGAYRPASQIVSQFLATIAGRYSQPVDPLRSIRSLQREMERWRPVWEFWDEMSTALNAYFEGDEHVFWEWVERHLGHKPDELLREALSVRMPRSSKELYPHGLLFHLKHHRDRLQIIDDPARFNEILSGISTRFGSLELALDVLCAGSETTREQMLDQMLQFTLRSEWDKPPPPGSDPNKSLVNEVSNLVRRQARLEGKSAKTVNLEQRLASLDDLPELSKFFGDPQALAAYLAVEDKLLLEWLAELARQRLTPHEFEVFELRPSGLALKEIATLRGVTPGAVRKQWYDIRHKLIA
jgi:hypothetical protein